jgi:hypothetical protein
MVNWRVAAGAAAFAAAVSLLAGVIGGIPFGIILVRLLVSSVFAGGLAVGALQLLKRFLPELVGGGAAPAASADPQAARPEVDILLPEENPHGEAGDVIEVGGGPEGADDAEPAAVLESVEPHGTGPDASPESLFGVPPDGEPEGEVPALPGAEPLDSGEPDGLEPADGAEALPDIDRLDSRFGAPPGGRGTRRGGRTASGRDLGEEEPETLARAVRTFLKKDQER